MLGVSGAKDIGKDPETGCQILSTNTIGFFGGHKTLLKIPKDNGIYNFVRVTGQWQASDCRQVARALDEISLNSAIIPTFLDIGGNVGLFSLQTAHLTQLSLQFFEFLTSIEVLSFLLSRILNL